VVQPDLAPLPLLVIIVGPTASGKTTLSLAIAEHLDGEIVNCDSVALYRELEIGTAKPGAETRARVPHHLFDIAEVTEHITAGDYARRARSVIAEISARGRQAIVVGGTGLYLRALLQGLFRGPQRSEDMRARLRERTRKKGSAHLHCILSRLDTTAAQLIHPNDAPKLIRAIEVCLQTRRPITALWQEGAEPLRGYRIVRIGLNPDRRCLYERIDQRARGMFELGLVEETQRLLAQYGPDLWPLRSLGYKQAAELLGGTHTREAAIRSAQQGHRNYAKRQITWFRREPDVHWLPGFGDDTVIQQQAMELVDLEKRSSSAHI
jgi:tRNA dimethylallyltransferase